MTRGYVFMDEDECQSEDSLDAHAQMRKQIRNEMIAKLAAEWNVIHNKIERQSYLFEEHSDYTREYEDYHAEQVEETGEESYSEVINNGGTEEEAKEARTKAKEDYWDQVRAKENEDYLRLQVIEEMLSELGVRMMRPYEHWNEEEAYMEYMENRYSYDY